MSRPKLTLSIPKPEAENQLSTQIYKGEQLISRTNSPFQVLIVEVRRDYLKFTTTTINMLSHMFDDPEVSASFLKFDMSFPNPASNSPFGEHNFYKSLATEQVNELEAILESLEFVPDLPQETTSILSTVYTSPEPVKLDATQPLQVNDSKQPKTLKQKIEDHPISVLVGTAVASASITVGIMIGLQSTRIENEKSRYEAIIENQKKDYESQLRELRTKVKELESRTSGKNSNASPADK